MKVTIIPSDSVVLVNGRAIHVDLSDMPSDIHAVQFDGAAGHVEYTNLPNEPITSVDTYQTWLDRWEAKRADEDAPPAPLTPEELQAKRIFELKEYRDELTENGGCLVQGKWFHTDVKSKQQQMALAMAGANLPAGLMWKTMDGSFIQMPPELAAEIFATQMTREATIFGICETKQQDDTPINEGWPERYADTLIVEPVVE